LEVFNSIIAHHLAENPNLIYGLLRSHKTFEDLGTFTLARGLREIRRIQLAKEEQARNANSKGKSRADLEDDQPHTEKQRMLERENSNALGHSSKSPSADSLTEVRVDPRSGPREDAPTPQDESASSQTIISSPTTEMLPNESSTLRSEKARGKMKERSSSSLETDVNLERIMAAGVGRNGFVPTQEWVGHFHTHCPHLDEQK